MTAHSCRLRWTVYGTDVLLIAVDAHSKWLEVLPTASALSERTVELLRDVFARYGLPEHLHNDNGSQFISDVFRNFMKANNTRLTFSAPYHPATNGQVKRFIKTFKQAMRSARGDSGEVKRHLAKSLFAYRNVPHATEDSQEQQSKLKKADRLSQCRRTIQCSGEYSAYIEGR